MLADSSPISLQSGTLNSDVHLPASSMYELLDFIGDELPRWRDRPDRRAESSETVLTSQLCAHLNSAARHSSGWDILQFRPEEPDEQQKGRRIDLIAAPCGVTVLIEGRGYSDFDPLMPIECKRLPTPKGNDRDDREYVLHRTATTGGIQRFKESLHGGAHSLGAMIAYVQEETCSVWFDRISGWIDDLVKAGSSGWTDADKLSITSINSESKTFVLGSRHERTKSTAPIDLRHFWLEMN